MCIRDRLYPDGEAGYKAFLKNKYDLCVFDVMMPKKDGFTLAQDVRAAVSYTHLNDNFFQLRISLHTDIQQSIFGKSEFACFRSIAQIRDRPTSIPSRNSSTHIRKVIILCIHVRRLLRNR